MTILITGATGNVGRNVLRLVAAEGEQVRALTRDPRAEFPAGVQAALGDLAAPDTLDAALRGVDRLFLFPVPQTARDVVDAAKRAGVRRIVVLSSGAVTGGFDTDFHLPVERAVQDSGLEWTHVRPGEFAMNKLALWGPSIRAEGVVRDPNPDVAWYPTHELDIAEVAAAALLSDGHAGRAYDVNGPDLLTYREQVRAIGDAIGREIRFEVIGRERARELYLAQGGFAAANADFLLGFEDYSGAAQDPAEAAEFDASAAMPTAEPVTGRARGFAEWARDHAADFRPAGW
ncbi:NAD(P)H-binding protein [Saccharopolyspora elongata]|uniref:NmrA family transcriptional regulator n=1 Tax=Saccharopolyspora elongata TaxID=2530387 RepID=A0A4R4ZJ25_9PSEU|nr:NAD(P)H-binding protein [Saccharopolyspora elongata]TDD56672.1 NmrA family transcriptional regulator [Saccharopolyspora elongata]